LHGPAGDFYEGTVFWDEAHTSRHDEQLKTEKASGMSLTEMLQRVPGTWDAWDGDPDALAAEFASRNVDFSEPLKTLMTVCAVSSSRTPTAMFCSSVVLGDKPPCYAACYARPVRTALNNCDCGESSWNLIILIAG
jgi:hypothetical protein